MQNFLDLGQEVGAAVVEGHPRKNLKAEVEEGRNACVQEAAAFFLHLELGSEAGVLFHLLVQAVGEHHLEMVGVAVVPHLAHVRVVGVEYPELFVLGFP